MEDMTTEELYDYIVNQFEDFELSDLIEKVIIIGKNGKLRMIELVIDNEKGTRYIG